MATLIIIAYIFIALFVMFILLVKNHEKTHDEWSGAEYTFGYICMALLWPVTMLFYVIYMAADAVVKTIKPLRVTMMTNGIWIVAYICLSGLITLAGCTIVDKVNRRRDEVDDLREKLKDAEDERDGCKETAESTHKLLQAEHDRADRLSAMNQGLTEDRAALKAYDPKEIEERLKKIREIRADEERQKAEAKLNAMLFLLEGAVMSNPYVGNPLSPCGCGTGITWR